MKRHCAKQPLRASGLYPTETCQYSDQSPPQTWLLCFFKEITLPFLNMFDLVRNVNKLCTDFENFKNVPKYPIF